MPRYPWGHRINILSNIYPWDRFSWDGDTSAERIFFIITLQSHACISNDLQVQREKGVGTQGRCRWNSCCHPEQPLNSRLSSIHPGNGEESSVAHCRAIALDDSLNVNTAFPMKRERTWSWEKRHLSAQTTTLPRPDFSSIKSPREKNKKVKGTAYGPSSVKN